MRRPILALCFLYLLAAAGGCASSRSAWVPLSPVGRGAEDDVPKNEKELRGITVSARLLEGKTRYLAQIEIHNGSKSRPAHGPDDVALQDGAGLVQPPLSAEDLKQEILRSATYQADYSLYSWPRYYYAPRRIYYAPGRYRYGYGYVGPFYHDDWFERRMDAERIFARADKKIASLDADYLQSREIPPGGMATGFIQFAKKIQKGATGPLKLSLTVEKRIFVFEFSPRS